MIDLSVVIVNWNAADLLVKCLESLQTGVKQCSAEIIVVDNASTDNSVEAVRKKFPEVKLIQSDSNLGFAKANNLGIQAASGRYICLVNSDVVVSEGCMDRMCEYMDQHTSIGILGPKVFDGDGTLQPSRRQFPSVWNTLCRALGLDVLMPKSRLFGGFYMTFAKKNEIAQVDVLSGCFWMARRRAIDEIGPLDESFFMYAEDVDYCKRSHLSGWRNVYFPDATIIHFGGASSSRAPVRFQIESLKATLQYRRKYHGHTAQILFLIFSFILHTRRLLAGIAKCGLQTNRQKALTEVKAHGACVLWLLGLSPRLR